MSAGAADNSKRPWARVTQLPLSPCGLDPSTQCLMLRTLTLLIAHPLPIGTLCIFPHPMANARWGRRHECHRPEHCPLFPKTLHSDPPHGNKCLNGTKLYKESSM